MLADKHPDQEQRIETLESYDILDSGNEADFDDIVALASEICDVPVSLISLVDDDRQWFKARRGFEPQETSLDQSVCSHSILQDELFVVEDMSTDARTKDNPLHVGGPEVQFYAGANLVAPNGMPIGTLCVLDNRPRSLNAFQRKALMTLSRQVMTQLELRKKLKQEESLRSEMDHRVRNSLQTIGSVMRMASRKLSDPDAINVLEAVERRIGAVASLHSELMGREGQGSIDIAHYFKRVVALLQEVSPENVTISVQSAEATLDAKKASAIGMIVSEFAANSIKHAFPDEKEGHIRISLTKPDRGLWVLTCEDDGVGRQDRGEPSAEQGRGLGEMLMASAAVQLNGQLEYETVETGTSLTVKFTA